MAEVLAAERIYAELGNIREEILALRGQVAQLANQRTEHPHVVRRPDMHRGEPTIRCWSNGGTSVESTGFFSPDPNAARLVQAPLQEVTAHLDSTLEFTRTFNTFVECFVTSPDGERVKLDFAQDTPFRLAPTTFNTDFGLQLTAP